MKTKTSLGVGAIAMLATFCSVAAFAAPTAPFADAPAPWQAFLVQAREADAISDPLKRCLAFPDMPGNKWPAGLAANYCHLLNDPEISLSEVAAYLDRGAAAELEAHYRRILAQHFSTTDFSERIHGELDIFALAPEGDALSQRWLAMAPDSPFANAARGLWLKNQAWKARGGQWIQDTPVAQLRKMEQLGDEAIGLFNTSLRLEPNLLPAHAALMDLARALGRNDIGDKAFAQADLLDPACRVTTKYHMLSLTPRWGGSYAAMDAYASELAQYVGRRPFVALTAALPLDDRGEVLFKAGKYAQAVVALAPGAVMSPYPYLYEKLGRSMAQQDGVDDWAVLATLVSAYRYTEGDQYVMGERGRMLNWAGDNAWSLKTLTPALANHPDDPYTNLLYGMVLLDLGRGAESESYLVKALDADISRAYALYNLVWAMIKSQQPDKAAGYSTRLVEQYPANAKSWLGAAHVRVMRGEKAEARAAAQRYLQLVRREGVEPTEAMTWAQNVVRATDAPADGAKR